jgi:hypothetical protein
MVGIGNRDLAACTRAGSPSCHAAADAGGCSRHDRASARRCRGHQRQAPAAAPEPPAGGRLAPAAAAGPCRPATSPVRPDTVRAVSRTCRPGGFTPAIHWPETCGYSYTGGDTRRHGEHLQPAERQRSPQSRTATSGILQLARTITDRRLFALVLCPPLESRRAQIGQLWQLRVPERSQLNPPSARLKGRGPRRVAPRGAGGRRSRPGCGRRGRAWPGCWTRGSSPSPLTATAFLRFPGSHGRGLPP